MDLKFVLFCILLAVLFQFNLGEQVKVTVQSVTSIAKTDDNFICATLDWWPSDKCDYNQCPWGKAGIINLDLNNTILSNAIKAFNPLRIRIGGSIQDQVIYKVGKASKKPCPQFKKTKKGRFGPLFGFSKGCLTMERWDELNQLFNQTRAKITFGFNALIGKKKKCENDTLWTGHWASENAHALMKYTFSKGYAIDSYELGNELCGTGVGARVGAKEYAKDTITLRKIVKKVYKHSTTKPQILGPAGFYDEDWFKTYLQATGPNVVDGLTHHIYNLGAGVDSTLIDKIQDPFFLNQVAQTYKDISTSIGDFGPWTGAWVGESGGAYNSGGKEVSHTFVNGFWYLDQLGMTSTFNHKVFCRQSLIGGNYGLLNTTTFILNPDYYGALLWHRLMGKEVLRTHNDGSPYLRVYSHCSKTKPGITMMLINMSNSTSFEVFVENDSNLYPQYRELMNDEDVKKQREEYHLTPKDGNIKSDVVLLNGSPLKLTDSMDIPAMNPKLVNSSTPIHMAPDSIVFATLREFKAPACA